MTCSCTNGGASLASRVMDTDSLVLTLAVSLGGVLFGALFIFLGRALWRSSRQLARRGLSAEARVLRKLRKPEAATWGGLEDYFVALTYRDVAGNERSAELKVMSKVWRQLREGGRFRVSYLPESPESVVAGPVFAHKIRCVVGAVMMLFGAAAVVVFPGAALQALLFAEPAAQLERSER
jgi:hypothetical protein